jgi:hypothetical protein
MAWRRRPAGDPYAEMPAELAEFDPLEWARPGETPEADGFQSGNWQGTWDHYHCHDRYTKALIAWFDEHPEADLSSSCGSGGRRDRVAGMTEPSLFDAPSITNSEVATAVRLLLTTGDEMGQALRAGADTRTRGFAALSHWWGSQLYGSSGALEEALTAWQQSGDPMPPPAPRPT